MQATGGVRQFNAFWSHQNTVACCFLRSAAAGNNSPRRLTRLRRGNHARSLSRKLETNPHRPSLATSYKALYRECTGVSFILLPGRTAPVHSRYNRKALSPPIFSTCCSPHQALDSEPTGRFSNRGRKSRKSPRFTPQRERSRKRRVSLGPWHQYGEGSARCAPRMKLIEREAVNA